MDRVLDCLELGDAEHHDCIVPRSAELADDGWGNVTSTELLSRIYSLTNPAAVDVYQSVEFFCNVY
ncbi:hypothetical protein C8R45DRAFT_1090257 [Mycena sanguinolenta]|nr:hypothetical protein C8R45DRAFT_1090257 [Mycena sanguinolenta]